MSPVQLLLQYTDMRIVDVRNNPKGIVLEVGLIGRRGTHRLLLCGDIAVIEIPYATTPDEADWEQLQIDIGDEMYERQRYEEDPCES